MATFQRAVERPDWTPPRLVTVELEYDPELLDCVDGFEIKWVVVAVQDRAGVYLGDDDCLGAAVQLGRENAFLSEILDYCREHKAHAPGGVGLATAETSRTTRPLLPVPSMATAGSLGSFPRAGSSPARRANNK